MIATVEMLKEQLNLTPDLGNSDDALLGRKLAAAQDHLQRLLGYKIEVVYGNAGQEEIPPALVEAVLQTAAHFYENREAVLVGVTGAELPFGVSDIVANYREWSFG